MHYEVATGDSLPKVSIFFGNEPYVCRALLQKRPVNFGSLPIVIVPPHSTRSERASQLHNCCRVVARLLATTRIDIEAVRVYECLEFSHTCSRECAGGTPGGCLSCRAGRESVGYVGVGVRGDVGKTRKSARVRGRV